MIIVMRTTLQSILAGRVNLQSIITLSTIVRFLKVSLYSVRLI
jgi:hypothetical protein